MAQAATVDYAALAAEHGGSLVPQMGPGAHPEARIAPPDPNAPVTLGDIKDNPSAAFARIGSFLQRDLTDKRLWLSAAAAYFAPKAFNTMAPAIARAIVKTPSAMVRGAAAVGDVVSPDLVGVASPRLGRALDVAQRMRDQMTPAVIPAGESGAGAVSPGASRPPPLLPTPPIGDTAPAPVSRPAATPASRPGAPKPHLTLDEFRAAQALIKQGYAPDAVLDAIAKNRLPKAWLNLPSDAEVRAKVTDRNATGKWPED